jgi:hypothetical protein
MNAESALQEQNTIVVSRPATARSMNFGSPTGLLAFVDPTTVVNVVIYACFTF